MKFKITQESNLGTSKVTAIHNLALGINEYLSNRTYGSDVEEFLIGTICLKPEFEQFFKPRKPKYIKREVSNNLGVEVVSQNSYGYDIKLDYAMLVEANEEVLRRTVANEIMKSLTHLDSLPKKITDFDKEAFKHDLKQYFEAQGLL
ncbi:hypothetical protein LVD17_27170 [Fulvivirga ulvae]|uniref:hypothetical protein n=1 Tax=Fulvivirga ulvae TaxID=2904245 RepID=UPI001F166A2D|nr:hypothetical protein [Fulvivirga ulvae]UII31973.1 hypothetical protein LVD17_27170 [Fulvivirga ulvae]